MTVVANVRRSVQYSTLDELVKDAENLASREHATLGNWSFGQILAHIAAGIEGSLDGYGFKGPWVIRKLVVPFIKNSVLTEPMRAGFKLPARAATLIPSEEVDASEQLKRLKAAVARFTQSSDVQPHPIFGKLTHEEMAALHLRHAELHMSFVIPAE